MDDIRLNLALRIIMRLLLYIAKRVYYRTTTPRGKKNDDLDFLAVENDALHWLGWPEEEA